MEMMEMFRRKTPDNVERDSSAPVLKPASQAKPASAVSDRPQVSRPAGIVPETSRETSRRATDIGTPAAIRAAAAQARRPVESKKLVVGREISLNGDITACDILVVEGRVEASLENSDILEVAAGGSFKGSVTINTAVIGGQFDGDLVVRGQLKLLAGGRITGTVKYASLVIEEGGLISGTIEHIDEGTANRS